MITPDSSVLVAGFVPSHRFHEVALRSLADVLGDGGLIAHTIAEVYSVLSGPAGPYRAEPGAVVAYLDQFLTGQAVLATEPAAYRRAIELLAGAGRAGGAVYDALIALAAADAGATLVSLDRRAERIYDLCEADVRYLDAI